MRKNNKGFSLVELIVVMAILAVIGGAIIGFMTTSLRSYRRVNADSNLANELQLTMNRLENLIMDCGNGISYEYQGTKEGSSVSGLVLDDGDIAGEVSVDDKILTVYDEGFRYIIKWKSVDKKLYYTKEERKLNTTTNTYYFQTGEEIELAEFVDNFQISINNSKKETLVTVTVAVTRDGRQSSASNKFALRNSLAINQTDDDAIYGDGGSGAVPDTYEGIVVRANGLTYTKDTTDTCDVLVSQGADVKIPFTATVKGTGFPSQDVIWNVQGSTAGASCSNGFLLIPSSETATTLYVNATSKMDASCTVTVTVNLMKITGISIQVGSSVYPDQFYSGNTIALNSSEGLNARVDGTGTLSDTLKAFHWQPGQNCSINGSTLTIDGAVGSTFVVRAISNQDTTVMAEYTGTIVRKTMTLKITARDDATTVDRGGSLKLTAKSTDGSMTYDSSDVIWNYTIDGASSGVSMSGSTLKVDSKLDYTKSYYVTVTAKLSYDLTGGEDVASSIGLQIPAVCLMFSESEGGTYAEAISLDMINVPEKTVFYQLVGVTSGAGISFSWDNQNNAPAVSTSGNKITIKKQYSPSGSVTGTAAVNGVAIPDSTIKIAYSGNLYYPDNSGSVYIAKETTNGWVTLNENVKYKVIYDDVSDWIWFYKLELEYNGATYYYAVWGNNPDNDWYHVTWW